MRASNQKNKNVIYKVAEKIKSVDGIDEGASLLGQILPGLAGSSTTASMLTLFTPFVWLGVLGLKEEYEESCEELTEVLQSQADNRTKLIKLSQYSSKWHDIINQKCKLNIPRKKSPITENNNYSLDELAEAITEYHRLRNEKIMAHLAKKYGWTGIVGMAGMFCGMIPATGAAVTDIVNTTNPSTTLAAITNILSIISGSFFIVGQTAMMIYAGNKVAQGEIDLKMCNEKTHLLNCDHYLSEFTKNHLKTILAHEKEFIDHNNISYGYATIFGQIFMAAGTIAGLAGASLTISVILLAIGAPSTIIPAIRRVKSESNEKKFKASSHDSDYVNNRLEQFIPLKLIMDKANDEDRYSKSLRQLEEDFTNSTQQLALIKLFSLMRKIIDDSSYMKKSPEQKLAQLEKHFLQHHSDSNRIKIKKSGLEDPIMNEVKNLYLQQQDNISKLFELSKRQARLSLLSSIAECMDENHSAEIEISANQQNDLSKNNKETLNSLGWNFPDVKSMALQEPLNQAIKLSKKALKTIRHTHANSITEILKIKETCEEIQDEASKDNIDYQRESSHRDDPHYQPNYFSRQIYSPLNSEISQSY